jgi:hypothetical protein
MKRLLTATLLCFSVFGIHVCAQQKEAPLTNTAVVQLVKAGFKEKTIIAIINNRPSNFKLDTEELIDLKRNHVSENIILAMLSSQLGTVVDDWEVDPFFKDVKRPNAGGDAQSQGTGIFGSGGTSQSQTRTGGFPERDENEGNTSGSARVRIIKPSVPPGGQSTTATLEKMPTLNNEGVIRLVEAGFSEGTIIKRIDQSPVDFDFSPAKLEELYKRRVTDAIIAAMRKAMGDK